MQIRWVAGLCLGLASTACGGSDDEKEKTLEESAKPVMDNYAELVFASYSSSHNGAVALKSAVAAFVANPTEVTHGGAKQAWLASRPDYLQTEVYRFYGGPIDDDDGLEPWINAWPMDEAYLDY